MGNRGLNLTAYKFVALPEEVPSLGVPTQDVADPHVGHLGHRHLARIGAGRFRIGILRAEADRGPGEELRGGGEGSEGRDHDHLHPCLAAHKLDQTLQIGPRFGDRLVHLPVCSYKRDPHVPLLSRLTEPILWLYHAVCKEGIGDGEGSSSPSLSGS